MTEQQLRMELPGIPQEEERKTVARTGGRWSVEGSLGKPSPATMEREKNDFYATDPIAAEWLCELEDLHHNIWECACGEGHLAKVFVAHGHNVRSTDLIDRGYGEGGGKLLSTNREVEWRYYHQPTV